MTLNQFFDCIIVYSSKKHFPYIEHILLHTKNILTRKGYSPLLLREYIASNQLNRDVIIELIDKTTFGIVILDGMRSNVIFELGLLLGKEKCIIILKSNEAEINVKTLYNQSNDIHVKDSNLAPKEFNKLENPKIDISKHFSDFGGTNITYYDLHSPASYISALEEELDRIQDCLQQYLEKASKAEVLDDTTLEKNILMNILLGKHYRNEGNLDDAIKIFTELFKSYPNMDDFYRADIITELGIISKNKGDFNEAYYHFNKAIEINPKNYNSFYNIAKIESIQNHKEKALNYLEKTIRLNKKYIDLALSDDDFENIKNTVSFNNLTIRYMPKYDYDFAFSFAGEDRKIAEQIANSLVEKGFKVFYDDFYKADLLGKDLSRYFKNIYGKNSVFIVIFISKHYQLKDWTNFEFEIARKEAMNRRDDFILPIRLDDTPLYGLEKSISYINYEKQGLERTVEILYEKIQISKEKYFEGNVFGKNIYNQKPVKIQKRFNKLVNLFFKLYKTKAKSSSLFTEEIHQDHKMRKYFGITARRSLSPGIPDDDMAMGFLYGRYYLIPNSATLRRDNPKDQKRTILNIQSKEEEVSSVLTDFFKEVVEFVKKEYGVKIELFNEY